MVERAKKITELAALSSATGDDLLVVVDSPANGAVTKSLTVLSLLTQGANNSATHLRSNAEPVISTATGTPGQIVWSPDYLYVCVATNTWKRATLDPF